MKKGKKIAFAIVIVIVAISIGSIYTYNSYITHSAIDYLCEKYNVDKDEFEVLDSEIPKYYLSDDAIPQLEKGYSKWEFKYNDKTFFVNRIDGEFYDDHQLDDVENWCVEWLKNNIEESTYLIELSSLDLYKYQQYINDNYYCFSKESIEQFLKFYNNQKINETHYLNVYYSDNGVDENEVLMVASKDYNLLGLSFEQASEKQINKIDYKNEKNYIFCYRYELAN